ncbi:MAG: hypothetical protein HWQ38_38045 [Nostoc sp. NMS7]|uniref:hypothetical protein n=1 Tax=Nostoc sp. NMS7 TaxID=2815391 RepID=UPI0025F8047D|nr:hypothetical protein [Nostoc sp. NMS7]MBN3951961.1 hypothetical protein [Nostoc sp. NMS7]
MHEYLAIAPNIHFRRSRQISMLFLRSLSPANIHFRNPAALKIWRLSETCDPPHPPTSISAKCFSRYIARFMICTLAIALNPSHPFPLKPKERFLNIAIAWHWTRRSDGVSDRT